MIAPETKSYLNRLTRIERKHHHRFNLYIRVTN